MKMILSTVTILASLVTLIAVAPPPYENRVVYDWGVSGQTEEVSVHHGVMLDVLRRYGQVVRVMYGDIKFGRDFAAHGRPLTARVTRHFKSLGGLLSPAEAIALLGCQPSPAALGPVVGYTSEKYAVHDMSRNSCNYWRYIDKGGRMVFLVATGPRKFTEVMNVH